jgi:putative transposase
MEPGSGLDLCGPTKVCQFVDDQPRPRVAVATLAAVARPLRLEVENGIYHLTARGNERKAIYRDAADRERFLECLGATLVRFGWRCLGYCLMTNHYHLLVRTPRPNLARGMRDLNGVYAQAFNRRHRRVGHLFQGRYRAVLIERDEHFLTAVAYIVRNPVRAGICATPGEWRWSSHGAALGERPPGLLALDELLAYLAPTRAAGRKLYRELVESDIHDDRPFYDEGVIDGGVEFARLHLADVDGSPEIPSAHRRPPRPSLERVLDEGGVEAIAAAYGHGYTMPAIARHLGLHASTVSRRLSRHRAQIKT